MSKFGVFWSADFIVALSNSKLLVTSSKFCNTFGLKSMSISSRAKMSLKNTSFVLSSSLLCAPLMTPSLKGKFSTTFSSLMMNLSSLASPILLENAVKLVPKTRKVKNCKNSFALNSKNSRPFSLRCVKNSSKYRALKAEPSSINSKSSSF